MRCPLCLDKLVDGKQCGSVKRHHLMRSQYIARQGGCNSAAFFLENPTVSVGGGGGVSRINLSLENRSRSQDRLRTKLLTEAYSGKRKKPRQIVNSEPKLD